MASACVNNIGISPENFLDLPPATFPWLSPRHSLSSDVNNSSNNPPNPPENPTDPAGDFEFRLEVPVDMLPADELFSDGKLVPLQRKPSTAGEFPPPGNPPDFTLFSRKAPTCSNRWRELLGLKKKQHLNPNSEPQKTTSSSPSSSSTTKSLKHFLRGSKTTSLSSSSENTSLNLPLLKDSDSESVSISSRLSLSSSSSSGHDHEDLPRLSLDSDKPAPNPNPNPISLHLKPNAHPRNNKLKNIQNPNPITNRVGQSLIRGVESCAVESRGVSVDSPRMNSSGKIVFFQGLERSTSSPSSFNGGPHRFKNRGMERSYSANVRVTPVLNVPVCSLRGSSKTGSVFGFSQFFSYSSSHKGSKGTKGKKPR